jgi:hypothetical protein
VTAEEASVPIWAFLFLESMMNKLVAGFHLRCGPFFCGSGIASSTLEESANAHDAKLTLRLLNCESESSFQQQGAE